MGKASRPPWRLAETKPQASFGEKKVEALRSYLKMKRNKEHRYHEVWLLLASTSLKGLLTQDDKAAIIVSLPMQKAEEDDAGGFVLREFAKWRHFDGMNANLPKESTLSPKAKKPDGHATGLVAYTLMRSGTKLDDPKLAAALKWLKKNQQPDGSWPAVSINKGRPAMSFPEHFMSDAATAWAVLALLESERLQPKKQ